MKANFGKRFTSYVIDFVIVMLFLNVLGLILPTSKNIEKLSEELNKISTNYTEKIQKDGNISVEEMESYLNESASLSYRIDKENFIYTIIGITVYILYYVVFQYKNGGQTLGKKLMRIKVSKDDGEVTINDFIFRSFIINSVLYNMIALILLFTTKDLTYIYSIGVLGFIQFAVMLTSTLMIVIRKDKKALQDVITKTSVEEGA